MPQRIRIISRSARASRPIGAGWLGKMPGIAAEELIRYPGDGTQAKNSTLPALSLRKPDAGTSAILRDKLHAGLLERGYKRLSDFGATTNVAFGGLKSLDRRRRYPGVFGQVILGPTEKRSRRFNLMN
jgi:hypothetical protein